MVDADGLQRGIQEYLAHLRVERGLSAHTLAAYGRDLARYSAFLRERGTTVAADVTAVDVSAFGTALRAGDEDHRPLSASSIARTLAAVRGLHRFWASEHVTPTDPAARVTPPKPGRRLPKALSVDQVRCLLDTAGATDDDVARTPSQLADVALLEVLYGTGARISEVVSLDVDDVSRALADSDVGLRLLGKGNKERLVPLGSYARAALDAWLVRGRPLLAGRGRGTPALFLNERGERLSRQTAFNRVQAVAKRAGIAADVSPHTLRHSYATHLLDGGADVRVVQELLGHASVTTTQLYTLVTVDHLRDVYVSAHPRAL